jgi:hypothetical protein
MPYRAQPRFQSALAAVLASMFLAGPASAQLAPPPRLPGTIVKQAAVPAPQEVVASAAHVGVQLNWKGVADAAYYLVLRGDKAAPAEPAIAKVAAPAQSYFDKGFSAPASYQVIAVMADGRRGASALAQYLPPSKAALAPPRAALAVPSPAIQQRLAQAPPALDPNLARTARAAPLGIASVHANGMPATFNSGHIGDTFVLEGTGLDGVSLVTLIPAYPTAPGVWQRIPGATQTYTANAVNVTAASLKFVIPALPAANPMIPYLVMVSKGAESATSGVAIHIGPRPVPRKILGVAQAAVRPGGRIRITGVGFNSAGVGVIGGYFGVGTPGSTSNPLISVANRSDSYAELWLPQTCDQEGILMLTAGPAPGGGSERLITGDQPIIVGCGPTPGGRIVGTEAAANGIMLVAPGSSVTIRGTALRYVTRVIDNQMRSYPFTFNKVGSGGSAFEQLSVAIPPGAGQVYQFYLENKLTDPVLDGTVQGIVRTAGVPTWGSVGPGWAEPGQMVRLAGRDLSNGTAPRVTVGGVAAQVLRHDPLWVEFRLAPGTTSAPIQISNEGGSVTASGQPSAQGYAAQPEFFVVSGSSVAQSLQASATPPAYGTVLTVTGQNLARLRGICVMGAPQGTLPSPGFVVLRRSDASGALQEPMYATSNTQMHVRMEYQPQSLAAGSAVQVYAPTTPPGDYQPTTFACTPNASNLNWAW